MPKSRLLKIELTQKGLDIIKICSGTKSIDAIFHRYLENNTKNWNQY